VRGADRLAGSAACRHHPVVVGMRAFVAVFARTCVCA
jgi:hypothetical protein